MWDIENILLTREPDFRETVGVLKAGRFLKRNSTKAPWRLCKFSTVAAA